nr:hypothetical protein [Desulfobacula sp.]
MPLLNDENLCSIYEKRPLSCQCFTSPDPVQCEKSVADAGPFPSIPCATAFTRPPPPCSWPALKTGRPHDQVMFIPALLSILEMEDGLWQGYGV